MNKWIKLSNLPNDFWGDVWLADSESLKVTMATVRIQDGAYPVWYSQSLTRWFKFRTDLQYLVMPLEYPIITEDDYSTTIYETDQHKYEYGRRRNDRKPKTAKEIRELMCKHRRVEYYDNPRKETTFTTLS